MKFREFFIGSEKEHAALDNIEELLDKKREHGGYKFTATDQARLNSERRVYYWMRGRQMMVGAGIVGLGLALDVATGHNTALKSHINSVTPNSKRSEEPTHPALNCVDPDPVTLIPGEGKRFLDPEGHYTYFVKNLGEATINGVLTPNALLVRHVYSQAKNNVEVENDVVGSSAPAELSYADGQTAVVDVYAANQTDIVQIDICALAASTLKATPSESTVAA